MSVKAIDTVGQIVEYVTASRWKQNPLTNTIIVYEFNTEVAEVPSDWIVSVLPFSQVDPGVEARD